MGNGSRIVASPARRASLGDRGRLAVARLRPASPALALVALLAFVPADTCLVHRALGVPCPGCGFTRALLALARGDLAASLTLHPLALPALALASLTFALAVLLPHDARAWPRFARHALTTSALALAAVGALRVAGALPSPP